VAVVCTTSRPEAVDPALRSPGLLDHEIAVPMPDPSARREQLAVLTRQVPLAADLHLDDIAGRTPGFVAADLAALVREAGVRAALRQKSDVDSPTVGLMDFDAALEVVRPTSMNSSMLELAKITLDDVGDMVEVKEVLTESVLWPLTYPDAFARLGVEPPRGVLLYGPPGCGKTYLVKAIAGTGKANVLSVKGAELLSKWVGDSEKAVRELFRRARDAAPTLVFLDEVDALAPTRGQSTDGGTTDRVVAALLTELDGVEPMRNVVVIGATNRPDLIDPALLRPGRLERLVYVPPPDAEARAEILRAAARTVPLASDVDLAALGAALDGFSAADCTALIREAALAAMRESLDAATVTAAHVETARTRVRPSLDPLQVAALAAYAGSHAIV
jgi:transitional endoplasmic reticulum ATPase